MDNERECTGCTNLFDETELICDPDFHGEGKPAWFCDQCAEDVGLKP
jgi:hypothetical protein